VNSAHGNRTASSPAMNDPGSEKIKSYSRDREYVPKYRISASRSTENFPVQMLYIII
jgi:hypothetical protein